MILQGTHCVAKLNTGVEVFIPTDNEQTAREMLAKHYVDRYGKPNKVLSLRVVTFNNGKEVKG